MSTTTAPGEEPEKATAARRNAERDEVRRALARVEGSRKWIFRILLVVAVVAAAFAYWRYRKAHPAVKPPKFMTDETSMGDVTELVQSTGTLQPVTKVDVGAQVSGRILKRYVDFNSKVKKGDLLAELDPQIYIAGVEGDKARVATAAAAIEGDKASLDLAKVQWDRGTLLHEQGLMGEADLQTAKGNYDAAAARLHGDQAALSASYASLKNSQANLQYTKIYAPIDGVVVSRSIDVGQTVAASFQAPVLFTIAQDLSEMDVLADVDEADLGRLTGSLHPEVDVRVEAYPGETFVGTLIDVRYNATTTSGVVTYPAVIEVKNPDRKLLPGMTATVSIRTASAKNVVRVPNTALRFHPTPPLGPDGKPKPVKPEPPPPKGKARIYLPPSNPQGEAEVKLVDVGISDDAFTVIENGSLPSGTKVVIDETDDETKTKARSLF